jgi:hypothetical protein
MKCPHCLQSFFEKWSEKYLEKDTGAFWSVAYTLCPACNKVVVMLGWSYAYNEDANKIRTLPSDATWTLVRPRTSMRPPCPQSVPKEVAEDYNEACLVLADSPKASAALSRRCLQNLLRHAAKVKPGDLFKEIDEAISQGMPNYLSESLHDVRIIGNFAAHPMKSQRTGEILPVEPHEAEWNLETLEQLFEFYYVQRAVAEAKKAALKKKLQEAGKPPVK